MAPPKIVFAGLKILEMVVLLVALGIVGHFTKEHHDDVTKGDLQIDPYDFGFFGRFEFFMYSTGFGVLIAILGLVIVFSGRHETSAGAFAMLAVSALWTVQLLVSTALLAKTLTAYGEETFGRFDKNPSICDRWDKLGKDYKCDELIGGVVCGFFAMALFAAETLMFYASYMHALRNPRNPPRHDGIPPQVLDINKY